MDQWFDQVDFAQNTNLDFSLLPQEDLPSLDFGTASFDIPVIEPTGTKPSSAPNQDEVLRRLIDITSRLERIELGMARKDQVELQAMSVDKRLQYLIYIVSTMKASIEKLREGLDSYTKTFMHFFGNDRDAVLVE